MINDEESERDNIASKWILQYFFGIRFMWINYAYDKWFRLS